MFDSVNLPLLVCTLLRTFHEGTWIRSNSCRLARHPGPPDDIAARRPPSRLHFAYKLTKPQKTSHSRNWRAPDCRLRRRKLEDVDITVVTRAHAGSPVASKVCACVPDVTELVRAVFAAMGVVMCNYLRRRELDDHVVSRSSQPLTAAAAAAAESHHLMNGYHVSPPVCTDHPARLRLPSVCQVD